ncbi:MAG: glutamine-hydrolyzing GMP synthase [Candidatus Bathyarchaeota archaeon]|nr:glutamine-hydrolyzing GMP synthase [Candidatus Bathyarchaeota archaeon]
MTAVGTRPDGVAILDFGGQYCHLIARRVREMSVYSEILPCDASRAEIEGLGAVMSVKGFILSGSPASIRMENAPGLGDGVLEMGLPVLGLCYGHQLMAHMGGGEVRRGERREYGIAEVAVDDPVGVLEGMSPVERVWMSHGDTVFGVPDDFEVLAHTDISPVAAYRHRERPLHGLQWHPEVVHTERGTEMLRNFVFGICGCRPNWRPADAVERAVEEIRGTVGGSKAIIALSGGVDSSVAAALAAQAIGDRLVAVHVDHGFMRMDESETVEETFKGLGVDLIVLREKDRFLERLRGVSDPEEKRRIIGEQFIRAFEAEARRAGAEYLIQGTIYPDRIESGFRRHSDRIKTHHNVAGIPLNIEFEAVIDPLRDLYKDEVRALGARLGLPEAIVRRQPFPGPGLAVRVIGEVTEEKLGILRRADAIVCEEVEASPLRDTAWQYLSVLTDTRSTGVKGDERAYGATVAVRIVESVDGMTASFAKAPWGVLERISTRITNEVPEVTRVVYDITHKPPGTIEWE